MLPNLKNLYFDQRSVWHLSDLARFPSDCSILDVGCGKGDFALLAPDRVVGIDFNPVSLKRAKNRGAGNILRASALRLPFADGAFECVRCADVIEHFDSENVSLILRELYRVLKTGGLLLLAGPMPAPEFWGDASHVRPYPPESLISLFVEEERTGTGTNQTLHSVGPASFMGVYWRYRPLVKQPWRLRTDERRREMRNLLHPKSLLFFFSNVLARFKILKYWQPAGFSLLLRKIQPRPEYSKPPFRETGSQARMGQV